MWITKGADQPAYLCSLIIAFVVCCRDIIPIFAKSTISRLELTFVAEQTDWVLPGHKPPKTGFLMMRLIYTSVVEINTVDSYQVLNELTKSTTWPLRPAKTQISLGIHPVGSEFTVCMNFSRIGSLAIHWVIKLGRGAPWAKRSLCWFCLAAAAQIVCFLFFVVNWWFKV